MTLLNKGKAPLHPDVIYINEERDKVMQVTEAVMAALRKQGR